LTKSEEEILKGYFPMFPIQVIHYNPQLSPHPEGETLGKKIDEEAGNS
jgi:hypothetical protein